MTGPLGQDGAVFRNVVEKALAQCRVADDDGLGKEFSVGAAQQLCGARITDTRQCLMTAQADKVRCFSAFQRAVAAQVGQQILDQLPRQYGILLRQRDP